MTDLAAVGDFLQKLGLLGATVLVIWGTLTRRWFTRGELQDREAVWQERLQEAVDDRNFWRRLALNGLDTTDKALSVVEGRVAS